MREGLRHLVQALNAPEAELLERRVPHVAYALNRQLRANAALAGERHRHPGIEREVIDRPIFIVGINRTGTTLLHRLMARDRRFWTVRRYELTEPVLPTGEYGTVARTADDPRRRYLKELMAATGIADRFVGLHHIDIDEPEEDIPLLRLAFSAWIDTVAYHVPDYGAWLAETGSSRMYAHHRQVMQHLTWQRRQRESDAHGRWLLKMPFHLMEFEALLEACPDARFIQTHREPRQFMGSWNSMVERIRSMTTEPRPNSDIGGEQLALMSGMLNRAMQFRSSRPELEERWIDLSYFDLVENPLTGRGRNPRAFRLATRAVCSRRHGRVALSAGGAAPARAPASIQLGGLRVDAGSGRCRPCAVSRLHGHAGHSGIVRVNVSTVRGFRHNAASPACKPARLDAAAVRRSPPDVHDRRGR